MTREWRGVEADTAVRAIALTADALGEHDRVTSHRDTDDLEHRRRDFMAEEPELYRYIALREAAKAYDTAGGYASGAEGGHAAANRIWALEGRAKEQYERMRE